MQVIFKNSCTGGIIAELRDRNYFLISVEHGRTKRDIGLKLVNRLGTSTNYKAIEIIETFIKELGESNI